MHIAGTYHRLVESVSQIHDLLVDLLKIFFTLYILNTVAGNHKSVISQWLYLQIIIEINDPRDPFFRLFVQDSLIQFSRLAGAAYHQSFPVFGQLALGDSGPPGIIIQMRLGYQGI